MSNKVYNYFRNMANTDRMSHAFLLCNTNFNTIKDELIDVLNSFFFEKSVEIENNPDIYYIEPDEGTIKKDQILNLQDVFKIKSQFNKNRVYIINETEKMNEAASNKLLKFLEEPESNIYAFLITSNLEKILPTIKSRCQIIKIEDNNNFLLSDYDKEFIDSIIKFILELEQKKYNVFANIYNYFKKKEDKENVKNIILLMKYFYMDSLNKICERKLAYFQEYETYIDKIVLNSDVDKINNKLLILNKLENMLEYNLNMNLFVDNLVIKLVGD